MDVFTLEIHENSYWNAELGNISSNLTQKIEGECETHASDVWIRNT